MLKSTLAGFSDEELQSLSAQLSDRIGEAIWGVDASLGVIPDQDHCRDLLRAVKQEQVDRTVLERALEGARGAPSIAEACTLLLGMQAPWRG